MAKNEFHSDSASPFSPADFRIRPLDSASETEISLVASRLRETLIEVLGEERGSSLYSQDWLCDRVRFYRDPGDGTSGVFVVETRARKVIAHMMARKELNETGLPYLYFSTIFVEPGARRTGIASRIIEFVESWARNLNVSTIVYNTASHHSAIIGLFTKHGYRITHEAEDMVQLKKFL